MRRLPAGLILYRLVSRAAGPFTSILLARRVRRGKENPQRLAERRGESRIHRPDGPLVWLHGASVGELASVLPLIERIRGRGIPLLVTTGTVTSGDLAEQRLPGGVVHQFVPLDVPRFIGRFLDHWRPDLALFVESELWPNTIIEASARGIPMLLINGRLSENSFHRWQKLPRTIACLLQQLDLCLTGTAGDARRFSELGAPQVATTGNLKLDAPAPPADRASLDALQDALGDRPVIAAASTHPGEEEVMVEAHLKLRDRAPGLLTLIVPRHPERGPAVAAITAAAGLKTALRSRGEMPKRDTDVYIFDTVGELGLIYRVAPAVFIGGSLVRHGGQNPIEAAKLQTAVLHGPHVWNFAEIYAALDEAHGAEAVRDSGQLIAQLSLWLADPEGRARVAQTGHDVVEKLGGALDRTLASIDPYLMQLQLHERARHA